MNALTLWQLFWSFIKIGAFSFGGGYAMIPLIEREIISRHHWLTMPQFIDVVAISQATPGPIAVNSATFVGYKVGGVVGSVLATAGVVLPSTVIILLLAWLFYRYKTLSIVADIFAGVRPAVVALILMAGISVLSSSVVDVKTAVIAVGSLGVLLFTKIDPILVLVGSAALGIILFRS